MEQGHILSNGEGGRGGRLSRDQIAARLAAARPVERSDALTAARLRGWAATEMDQTKTVPASVLVPLVERPEGMTVMLTRRTAHLNKHAGQVSFPGGRVEHDEDALAAALRETDEEIGLDPALVDVLGRLDDYVTITGFRVTPFVGLIAPGFTVTPDPFEVAEIFEVPLAFLLDPANHQRHSRVVDGRERPYYAMPYNDHYIWGATAGMLMNLYEVLTGACASC